MSEPLLYQQQGAIVTLTLNRPETRNSISETDMIEAIVDAVDRVNRDMSVSVAILTGAGSAFSSGGNVKHMRDRVGMFAGGPAEIRNGYRFGIQQIPPAIYHIEVPTIAAVNGPAFGAGCDLTMMCDMRIASEKAVFGESFVKLGIIPGDGGAWFLPRIVGMSRACEMTFTGDPVNAPTALEWGIVSKVVPPDELLGEAGRLAARIAVNPPHALRMAKKLIREGQHQRLESILEMSAAIQALAHETRDHQEAVAAMLEKRSPTFVGK
jgi:enoyl-CoA hydratase/carnithine racemase